MNPDAFEPIVKLLLILFGIVIAIGVIGILVGIVALGIGIAAFFVGGVSKITLIVAAVLLGALSILLSSVFWDTGPHYTTLTKAIWSGKAQKVEKLLKKGADPNEYDSNASDSPLILAIDSNNVAIVNLLLDYGADVNQMRNFHYVYNYEPVMHAVEKQPAIVAALIEHGAAINVPGRRPYVCPLAKALVCDKMDNADFLVTSGADVNFCSPDEHMSILMNLLQLHARRPSANFDFLISKTKWLIARGADLGMKDKNAHTALDYLHTYLGSEEQLSAYKDAGQLESYKELERLLTIVHTEPDTAEMQPAAPTASLAGKSTVAQSAPRALPVKAAVSTEAHIMLDDIADGW